MALFEFLLAGGYLIWLEVVFIIAKWRSVDVPQEAIIWGLFK